MKIISNRLGADPGVCDAFAAAVEMIHSFSLIHDDLPCMDDDDMRRGKPATHIQFGEATALLAGDLLAIEAFNVIAGSGAPPEVCGRAVTALASASGARGMIYGQELDLRNEKRTPTEAGLLETLSYKTGALIRVSAALGVIGAGLEMEDEAEIEHYAQNIGLVFQIVDDLLDVTSTAETLGKPIGSDAEQGKTTFVTMFGMTRSRQQVADLTAEAIEELGDKYGERADFLCEYARRLADRVN
ncbi:polyprenyl synthetase family protein [Ruminococcaceae bacterium OttesenSCG-928-D13]|nr:polyprenyl synthetase family protein [Ruminococcaceae bacterium OttesenSCG-928-D13]